MYAVGCAGPSSSQLLQIWEVGDFLPSIFGRIAYPVRREVKNRVLLGRKRHGRAGIQSGRQRWERPGWQQARKLEDHRMTAAAKSTAVLKSLNGFLWNRRPSGTGGRPM